MEEELRSRSAVDLDDPGTLRRLLLAKLEREEALVAEVAETRLALTHVQAVVEEARPKVEAFDAFMSDDGLCNLRTAARAIDAPSALFFKWVEDKGYVFRENGEIQPSAAMRKDGYMKLRTRPDAGGVLRGQTMVTRGGLEWLRQRWRLGLGKVLALQAALSTRHQDTLPGL